MASRPCRRWLTWLVARAVVVVVLFKNTSGQDSASGEHLERLRDNAHKTSHRRSYPHSPLLQASGMVDLHALPGRKLLVRADSKGPSIKLTKVHAADIRDLRHSGTGVDMQQYLVRVVAHSGLETRLSKISAGRFFQYLPHDTYAMALSSTDLDAVLADAGVTAAYLMPPDLKVDPALYAAIRKLAKVGASEAPSSPNLFHRGYDVFMQTLGARVPPASSPANRSSPSRADHGTGSRTIKLVVILAYGRREGAKDEARSLLQEWERVLRAEVLRGSVTVKLVSQTKGTIVLDGTDGPSLKKVVSWLALQPRTHWVEEYHPPHALNKYGAKAVQSFNASAHAIWDKGIKGDGQIVGVADTGLDYDNCLFRDEAMPTPAMCTGEGHVATSPSCINHAHRKVVTYRSFAQSDYNDDVNGHGTHVAGSVAGNAIGTDSAHVETREYNGAAPLAKLAFDDIGAPGGTLPGIPDDLADGLFPHAYAAGARVHSNSWGASSAYYTTMAMDVDEFSYEHEDFLVLVAAGNDGPDWFSVGTPATAKNSLSVGATENAGSSSFAVKLKVVDAAGSQGMFDYEPAAFGAAVDLDSPSSGEIELASPRLACDPVQTGLAGKVAVVWRGTCEFGLKARHAQDAGAIGVIVVNNVAGLMTMSGGSSGPQVAIPVIMVTPETGEAILRTAAVGTTEATFPYESSEWVLSHEEIASFSSRGPGADLRLKPDIVCPGVGIQSARGDGDPTSNNCGLSAAVLSMSGTSMATPLCAGAAALVREYFLKGFSSSGTMNMSAAVHPSAALIKAVMIHSAQPVRTEAGFAETYPNVDTGFGRLSLDTALMFSESKFEAAYLDSQVVSNGGVLSFCFQVGSSPGSAQVGEPDLRVSLVWTDPPGDPLSSKILVNDLDLVLFNGSHTWLGNNHSQSDETYQEYKVRDSVNNAEQVRVSNAAPGRYAVHVLATDVGTSQKFALVASAKSLSLTSSKWTSLADCLGNREQICLNDCNGHGTCLQQTGLCQCELRYGGIDCSREIKTLSITSDGHSLSVSWMGMSYYYFTVPAGASFSLILTTQSLASCLYAPGLSGQQVCGDADFYLAKDRLPLKDDYDARIADGQSSGTFSSLPGQGGGNWFLGLSSNFGTVNIFANLTTCENSSDCDVDGGGGEGDDDATAGCLLPCECGTRNQMSGTLTDGDGDYPNNALCWWILAPTNANTISLTFTEAIMEYSYDYIFVLECAEKNMASFSDCDLSTAAILWAHTGSLSTPATVTSDTGVLLVVMETDFSVQEAGFSATWTSATSAPPISSTSPSLPVTTTPPSSTPSPPFSTPSPPQENCTHPCHCGVLQADTGGVVEDGSGSNSYENNANCVWKIISLSLMPVQLNFLSFSVEDGRDFVSVYSCESVMCANKALLARLTGSFDMLSQTNFQANAGVMLIHFTTDDSVGGSGWSARFMSVARHPEELFEQPAEEHLSCLLPVGPAHVPNSAWTVLRRFSSSNISSGGLGTRTMPGRYELWLCLSTHQCAQRVGAGVSLFHECRNACNQRGFDCGNSSAYVSSSQAVSCVQACMMRMSGGSEQECQHYVHAVPSQGMCEALVNGFIFTFCGGSGIEPGAGGQDKTGNMTIPALNEGLIGCSILPAVMDSDSFCWVFNEVTSAFQPWALSSTVGIRTHSDDLGQP